jgi:hypothetical protein
MDISVVQKGSLQVEDRSWLGSADGTGVCKPATLAPSLFTKATHFPNGVVKSGTWLAKVTAVGATQGLYGPYTPGASNGLQTVAGVLYNTTPMAEGGANTAVPLQERGVVIPAKLPANNGLDAGARTALAGRFIFRD